MKSRSSVWVNPWEDEPKIMFSDRWQGMMIPVDTLIHKPVSTNHLIHSDCDMAYSSVKIVSIIT